MLKKFAIILNILVFVVLGGCYNPKEIVTGKEVVTEEDFIAASSIEILQTTTNQLADNNFDLLGKHMETGDYYVLPQDTKIKILQTIDYKYVQCLVLDGKRSVGEEFWTFVLSFDYGSNIPFELIITE